MYKKDIFIKKKILYKSNFRHEKTISQLSDNKFCLINKYYFYKGSFVGDSSIYNSLSEMKSLSNAIEYF
jgi:hypothetical protein